MKMTKRITALFMAMLIVFSSFATLTVNAATEGTNTTIDATYRCYKGSNTGTSGTAPIGNKNYYWHYDASGKHLNCPIRFMKEKGTSKPVYCIECGATFDGGYTYKTYALEDSPYWQKLSATAKTGITYTTMYGYPVHNYGAANCDAYAATQTIIWEFTKGYRNLSGRTNAYFYDLMIKGSPAESAYNQLSNAIIAHNKRPSFASTTTGTAESKSVEMKYNNSTGEWGVTLTDSNGVLSGYAVASDGGLSVSKSGNSLTLTTKKEISGKQTIELARPLPTTGQALLTLYSSSSQNAIVGQLRDPVTSYLTLTTEDLYGKVSAEKVDEAGSKLTGVTFGIYADSSCNDLITTMTTDDGTAISENINLTQYPTVYVKEKSMSENLDAVYKLNPKVYTVNLVKNSTVSATNGTPLVNEWKDAKVKVIKQNEAGNGLEGVVFGVYSDEACTNLLTSITTGKDGIGTSEAIDVGKYGSRKVFVREVSMTEAQKKVYVMNTKAFEVELSAGKTTTANGGNAIVNNWLPGKISVNKINSAGKVLSGAAFTAYTDKDCTEILKDKAGNSVVLTTDEKGYAQSTEIYIGKSGSRTVYVKETALNNPDADIIALNKTVFSVTLQPNVTSAINDGNPVVNQFKPGKIKVVKENQNGNRLEGITFSIYTDKACRELLSTMVTNDDGVAVSEDIPIDGSGERTLYVKETALAKGQEHLYELSPTIYTVTVYPNQTRQVNNGKSIINRWTLGQISLTKQNENGDALEGVAFAVYVDSECLTPLLGANGEQVKMITDADGKAISDGIEVTNSGTRKLYVKEISMPEDMNKLYSLNTTVYPVVVSAGKVSPINDGMPVINNWKPAQFILSKINPAGGAICGAEFTAYTDKECTKELTDIAGEVVELTTDADGCALSPAIKVGKDGSLTIYLKETAVNNEDVVINNTVFETALEAGKTIAVNDGKPIIDDWHPGRIALHKENENGEPLESVTFGVFENAECTVAAKDVSGSDIVLVTDKNGDAESADILINADGRRVLYVRELSVTEEQAKVYALNKSVFEVTVMPNMIALVNDGEAIVNDWLPASFSLKKQDEDGNFMQDVSFTAYDDKECTLVAKDISGSDIVLITDKNGYACSGSIAVDSDGERTLYIRETDMTTEQKQIYTLNDTVFDVVLSAGGKSEINNGEPIINKFTTAPIRITKADITTAEGVPGATIQIFDNDGKLILEDVTGDDGKTGEIELRVGHYTFVETVAPDGYMLNKTVFDFSINSDGTVTGDCTVTDKPTEWKISKKDVTAADTIPGAEITISDSDGKEVFRDTTGEDGTVTAFYLPAGEYTFRETVAPEGYVLNEEIFKFAIDEEGNVTGDNTITDRKIKGNISVTKIDEANGKKLKGATFALFTANGKTKLSEGVTGDNGVVTFKDIEYGKYVIKEINAPVGFLMKETAFEVEIKEDGKTVELTVSNSREPIVPLVPKTGDSSAPLIVCVLLMLASAAVIVMLWFKKSGDRMIEDNEKKKWWREISYRFDRDGNYNR